MSTAPAFYTRTRISRPAVERPDSVTHWTCPDAPPHGDTHTHHLSGAGRCRYCGRGVQLLIEDQVRLLGTVVDVAGARIPIWQVTRWERDGNSMILYWEVRGNTRRTQVAASEIDRLWSLISH